MAKKNNNYLWIGIAVVAVVVLAIVLILNSNNNSKNEITCNSPYIKVGTECCLDENSNNICDNDEKAEIEETEEEVTNNYIISPTEIDEIKAKELAKDYVLTYSKYGDLGISYEEVISKNENYFIKIKNGDWCSVIKINKIKRTVESEIDGTCLLCSSYEFWGEDPWEGEVPTTTAECKTIIFENFAETLEANGESCEIVQIDSEGDKTICRCCSNLFDEWDIDEE